MGHIIHHPIHTRLGLYILMTVWFLAVAVIVYSLGLFNQDYTLAKQTVRNWNRKSQGLSVPLTQKDIPLSLKRFSGAGCFGKNSPGINDRNKFNPDFNLDAPNTTAQFVSVQHGISFEVPHNIQWGNADCHVSAYVQTQQDPDHWLVEFGRPNAQMSSEYWLKIVPRRDVEAIRQEQMKSVNEQFFEYKIRKIGDNEVIVYDNFGDYAETFYEIISPRYNYIFSYRQPDQPRVDVIQELEKTIATVQLVPLSNDDLCHKGSKLTVGGQDIFPIAKDYEHLSLLGQFFTAAKCSDKRLQEVNQGEKYFNQGLILWVKTDAAPEFLKLLEQLGFVCAGKDELKDCLGWKLEQPIVIKDLAELAHFADQIVSEETLSDL